MISYADWQVKGLSLTAVVGQADTLGAWRMSAMGQTANSSDSHGMSASSSISDIANVRNGPEAAAGKGLMIVSSKQHRRGAEARRNYRVPSAYPTPAFASGERFWPGFSTGLQTPANGQSTRARVPVSAGTRARLPEARV